MALTVVGYTGRRGTQCSRLYKGGGTQSVEGYTGKGSTQCSRLYREKGHSV